MALFCDSNWVLKGRHAKGRAPQFAVVRKAKASNIVMVAKVGKYCFVCEQWVTSRCDVCSRCKLACLGPHVSKG